VYSMKCNNVIWLTIGMLVYCHLRASIKDGASWFFKDLQF